MPETPYQQWPGVVTDAMKATLFQNGFVIVRDVLSPRATRRVRRLVSRAALSGTRHGSSARVLQRTKTKPTLLQISNARLAEPGLAGDPAFAVLMGMASGALGASVRCSFDAVIVKSPRSAGGMPWHQDCAYDPWRSPSLAPGHELAIWLALDDYSDGAGSVCYVPRSHLGDSWNHRLKHRTHALEIEYDALSARAAASLASAVTCLVAPGDVCVHLRKTIHSSTANTTSRTRFAWSLNYVAQD